MRCTSVNRAELYFLLEHFKDPGTLYYAVSYWVWQVAGWFERYTEGIGFVALKDSISFGGRDGRRYYANRVGLWSIKDGKAQVCSVSAWYHAVLRARFELRMPKARRELSVNVAAARELCREKGIPIL